MVNPPGPVLKVTKHHNDYHLRHVMVWRPDLQFSKIFAQFGHRMPCLRQQVDLKMCKRGWLQHKSRRGILGDGCCDLMTKWCICKACQAENKAKKKKMIMQLFGEAQYVSRAPAIPYRDTGEGNGFASNILVGAGDKYAAGDMESAGWMR